MTGRKQANKKKKGQQNHKHSYKEIYESDNHDASANPSTTLPLKFAVIGIAIAIGVRLLHSFVDDWEAPKLDVPEIKDPDPTLASFLEEACKVAFCHDSLHLSGRSFRVDRTISIGEKIVEVPREMQIWDLDALRDPYIRENLFRARHKLTGNRLGNEAFLAAYVAVLLNTEAELNSLKKAYLETLPKFQDLAFHPILWDKEELRIGLGATSSAYSVIKSYRNMVLSEYEAFQIASENFSSLVSYNDFATARIHVLSRTYHVGTPTPSEEMSGTSLSDELQTYRETIGLDLMDAESGGCRAFIPIVDLFNHHHNNNVNHKYEVASESSNNDSFVLSVGQYPVRINTEPMVSYGRLTDAHLFSRYGFVNGDGSGYTQASMSFYHDVLNLQIASQYNYLPNESRRPSKKIQEYQRQILQKYLFFDDGYESCIEGPTKHPSESVLKKLKMEHLIKIANEPDRWIMNVPPRDPTIYPPESIDNVIDRQVPRRTQSVLDGSFSLSSLLPTCRLLEVTNSDYDGQATQILQDNLENSNFELNKGNDALEFRATFCMGRFIRSMLNTFGDMREEIRLVKSLNEHNTSSRNWTIHQVRLGEMEALQSVASSITQKLVENWADKQTNPPTEYFIRNQPCPANFSAYLAR